MKSTIDPRKLVAIRLAVLSPESCLFRAPGGNEKGLSKEMNFQFSQGPTTHCALARADRTDESSR
jgi:hypothetical protein